jgi:subtilisin family serine protease
VLFLWDQQAPANSMSPAGFGYGREFTQAAINSALNQANPYAALGYQPDAEAHGTHVTDIAAGNGRATGAPGVAPEADIIFVQLHGGDFADDESFGNSKTLLEAVDYIFEKAQQLGRPCVVNLSLGTHGGPHDGSTLAEQGFDVLLDESGRALVIAAGNSSQRGSHAAGTLNPGQSRQLSWQIRNGDATDNELEVWYAGDRALSVTLIAPSGARLGPVQPGNTVSITQQGTPSGSIISRIQDPNNNSNQINIILRSSMPAGTWKVELTNTGTAPAAFDAWIERDDFGQSRFAAADDNRTHTIGSISCGQKTLVVGSYQATVALRDISNFSSSGPTRDGREKPEISAPGDMVRAANSLTQGAIRMSGTSMAAPHVTGLVALIQQAAGRPLSCDEVRALVMSQSRQSPPPGGSWDPRFGMGRIGAPATVLAALPATPAPIEAPIEGQPLVAAYLGQGHENGNAALAFDDLLRQMATVAERAHSKVSIHIAIEPVQAG